MLIFVGGGLTPAFVFFTKPLLVIFVSFVVRGRCGISLFVGKFFFVIIREVGFG